MKLRTRKRLIRAAKLYKSFQLREPKRLIRMKIPALPTEALAIGKLVAVIYASDRDGTLKHYRHDFNSTSRPLLVASHDGKQLLIVGGRYRFTNRGIVDQRQRRRK